MRGRVVRFDEVRGYGFIRPREGGEDVFMHANDLIDEKYLYQAGSEVEFFTEQGEKGLKASEIRLVRQAAPERRAGRLATPFAAAPARGADLDDDDDDDRDDGDDGDEQVELLSVEEFRIDLTEALLGSVDTLTVAQLREVRACVTELVRKRGWLVD